MNLSLHEGALPSRTIVVGGGPSGCATAAMLQSLGHAPSIWSPTGRRFAQPESDVAGFTLSGAQEGDMRIPRLLNVEGIGEFDTIVVCLPGSAYEAVLGRMLPCLRTGQTVIVSGSLSLCPLWLRQSALARGQSIRAIGWGTTLCTAHFRADGSLRVNKPRTRIDMASIGLHDHVEPPLALCERLFGARFAQSDTLLAPTLANINPCTHAAEVIPNLSRIDLAETWSLFGNFTHSVAALAELLDAERLGIARAYGLELPTLREHYHRSYHVPLGSLVEMTGEMSRRGLGPSGPVSLNHRYIVEDVPFGLVFLEAMARTADVPTPAISGSITLLEALGAQNFRTENFLVDALALGRHDVRSLQSVCASVQ
ncbi:NAD/NADP octopine/nopaline dehydrogenase family protein [Hydrogenophaga sp.]|uniref:NAD/NADP octopine/nopaline dehydrogenase family protein n=1 Tax=Hydrogenophaga sp. TaxID=1904254 RepID=UPI00271F3C24|nr:NAD/NADP octopine/nopaline dehydrogenase family protein [Hydrogenophaga sp.]MDO9438870.1 NAD/NADP octopine/nopaline dehydrogenase family protein [Hydrogenophaga sp.]